MHAHSLEPSPWIVRFAHLVAPGGRVLDLASGSGRHARWFARRGCTVLAIDRDAAALAEIAGEPRVETAVVDLESGAPWPCPGERFDLVLVTNYLHRPLFPDVLRAVAPGGALLYETFAAGNEVHGPPRNRDFLLAAGELLDVFAGPLTVVAFEQGEVQGGARNAVVQRLAAVASDRAWPPVLDPPRT